MLTHWWLWTIIGYVSGSISFALVFGRLRGIDIRKQGSGNLGATNVGRVLGRPFGIVCFLLDVLKGFLPVFLAGYFLNYLGQWDLSAMDLLRWLSVVAAAVIGHVFPFYLGFKGGKGVATSLGVLLGVYPLLTLPGLVGFGVWLAFAGAFRYVSLASIAAAISLPLLTVGFAWANGRTPIDIWPATVLTTLLALMVVVRHRSNIARLKAGTESKLFAKRDADGE